MFRKMRRFKQELGEDDCKKILEEKAFGTLSLFGDDGYPYSVPLNHLFVENKIYFHSAKDGHKIDAINNYEKASFSVVSKNDIKPEEYTTYFKSVIAFGKIRVLTDYNKSIEIIEKLCLKFNPNDSSQHREKIIKDGMKGLSVIEFSIEHLTGKQSIEYIR